MPRRTSGFTMVELVFVILIGSILTSMALSSFRNVTAPLSVRGARATFVSLHAKARMRAVERGDDATFVVSMSNDSIAIMDGGTVIEGVNFRRRFNVDLQSATDPIELCMGPRGIAEASCTNITTVERVLLVFNDQTDSILVVPLGQLIF